MRLLTEVLDAFEDQNAKSDQIIKSGTLRTTRGTALVGTSVVATMALLDAFGPELPWLETISPTQKFYGAIAIGFVWAITAAADSLARGIATSRTPAPSTGYATAIKAVSAAKNHALGFRPIEPPIEVRLKDKEGADENGWLIVASAITSSGCEFCCVKGGELEWRAHDDANVLWTVQSTPAANA